MVEIENAENEGPEWQQMVNELNPAILDVLAGDSVNVHCVNSTDFVVGKQTNFNGPVTIINCESNLIEDKIKTHVEDDREKIVIRNKVLSESAATTIQEVAEKKVDKTLTQSSPANLKKKQLRWFLEGIKNLIKAHPFIWIISLAVLFGVAVCLMLIFIPTSTEKAVLVENNINCHTSRKTGRTQCIHNKYDWGGRKNFKKVPIGHPVHYVVISNTNQNFCFDFASCLSTVKDHHLEEISSENITICNFFVGGEGTVFEDLGWGNVNMLTGLVAENSVEICLMGNMVDYPTFSQLEAAKNLIQMGVSNGYVARNYVLLPSNSTSPDREISPFLYTTIQKWPKFRESPKKISDTSILKDIYRIYTKEEWGGKEATSFIEMKLPVPYVVISHTVTNRCYKFQSCSALLRNIQSYHFSLEYADISGNFYVDSSGNIYEGRGWKRRNTAGSFVNGRNLAISFIGDFSKEIKPSEKQLEAVRYLIQYAEESGKIAKEYALLAANSTHATLSPGKNVYRVIKTWPHFDPEPRSHLYDLDDY